MSRYRLLLKPGDIIGIRSPGRLGRMILAFQRNIFRGEQKSEISHVALVTSSGHTDSRPGPLLVEALTSGVSEKPYWMGYPESKPGEIIIARPLNLSTEETEKIVDVARRYIGNQYGWVKILLHAVGMEKIAYRTRDDHPICSWPVAMAYASIGRDFGKPAHSIDPDDILDFARANPDKYDLIRDDFNQ